MPDDDAVPSPDELVVKATGDDSNPVIVVSGELDASGTQSFGACLSAVLDKHPGSIAIDTGGLTFLDSSGLRSLLVARAAAEQADAAFRIRQPSPAVRRMVERTGLHGWLLDE
jgi:anti-sigma B factor antagonist